MRVAGDGRVAYVRIAQFRFDPRLETIAAECALLLDIGADLAELVVAQRVCDKVVVGLLALVRCCCKRDKVGCGTTKASISPSALA